jgi:RHS repeat-associated protein
MLEYADQRYYASNFGRFMTADRYVASGGTSDPKSWNRYSYVEGDPVNFNDPGGRFMLHPEIEDPFGGNNPNDDEGGGGGGGGCGPGWETDASLSGPCCPTSAEGFQGNPGDPTPQPPNSACYAPEPTPAGQKLVPTSIRIETNADGTNRDCYTSFFNQSTGSFAERDILYGVYDQNGNFMSDVNIREILTIVSGSVCPTGTVRSGNQCTGSYGDPSGGYFLDSLAASPGFGNATYTQIFQVTTLPGVQGLQGVFNLPLQIMNNYTSGGSQSNTISLTPQAITLNGNNGGMTPCGPIGHP